MKKTPLIICIILLIAFASCRKVDFQGETGKIIYKKYSPPANINQPYCDSLYQDTLFFDFDEDGNADMTVRFAEAGAEYAAHLKMAEDWLIGNYNDEDYPVGASDNWTRSKEILPIAYRHIGIAHRIDMDELCYGWLDTYVTIGSDGTTQVLRFYLNESAYCTCPNYPLKWGEK